MRNEDSMNLKNTVSYEEELERHGQFATTNVGNSMMPFLRPRQDILRIEKKKGNLRKYDVVLFKRKNGQYVLHRILKVRENDYLIVGDNCWSKEYVKEEQILGILTEVLRNGKRISMKEKKYLFYIHLWCDFFFVRAFLLKLYRKYIS